MRKEMNSKSKRKWVAGGLAAFASVALLTTGFATWIVGTQKLDASIDGTTVNVDTAKNESIELTMTIQDVNKKLVFAETSPTESGDFVRFDNDIVGDLTLEFDDISITYGSDSAFNRVAKKLEFSITSIKNGGEEVKETANTVNLSTFDRSGECSYFAVPAPIALTDENGSETTVSGSATKYTLTNKNISFTWGTAFGGKTPAKFYNDYFTAHPEYKTAENAEIVRNELIAMKTALDGATINLKAAIVNA